MASNELDYKEVQDFYLERKNRYTSKFRDMGIETEMHTITSRDKKLMDNFFREIKRLSKNKRINHTDKEILGEDPRKTALFSIFSAKFLLKKKLTLRLMREIILIHSLRENSRISLTNLSKKTGIPISTLVDYIRSKLSGRIIKNTVLLDWASLGFHSQAKILLKFSKEDKDKALEYLSRNPFINNLAKINNGYHCFLEIITSRIVDTEAFLEKLEEKFSVEEKQVFYITDEIKREAFTL